MAYYLNLFSPETYEVFSKSARDVSGFRQRHKKAASRIHAGDRFVCYMTKLSRWVGILDVLSDVYLDESPLFIDDDPFVQRFKVRPLIWLPKEEAVPIREPRLWDALSFTRDIDPTSPAWTGKLRTSLNEFSPEDGALIERVLTEQQHNAIVYDVDPKEYAKHLKHTIRRLDKTVTVTVPDEPDEFVFIFDDPSESQNTIRESYQIQALLARIGESMGFHIWLPANDRSSVMQEWTPDEGVLLSQLPLSYDDTTLHTIENIDVIWLRGRAIARAFEVEHTTSIYSGILRMADLLALQPNMDIRLHIVAPHDRRDKVFNQITRPVFSLLDKRPLSEVCSFIGYEALRELAALKHLHHLNDSVLDDYAEEVE